MKQKEMARWLKLVTLLAAAAGLFTAGFFIPSLLSRLLSGRGWKVLPLAVGFCWLTALPCFACLWQFWGICTRIGNDRSFCAENAAALRRISHLLFADCVLYLLLGAAAALVGELTIGRVLLVLTVLFVGVTLTVLSAALSHLILKASVLQQDADLTI